EFNLWDSIQRLNFDEHSSDEMEVTENEQRELHSNSTASAKLVLSTPSKFLFQHNASKNLALVGAEDLAFQSQVDSKLESLEANHPLNEWLYFSLPILTLSSLSFTDFRLHQL